MIAQEQCQQITVPLTEDITAIVFSAQKMLLALLPYGLISTDGEVIQNTYTLHSNFIIW